MEFKNPRQRFLTKSQEFSSSSVEFNSIWLLDIEMESCIIIIDGQIYWNWNV